MPPLNEQLFLSCARNAQYHAITEAGLSRINTHTKSGKPFAMISASKHNLSSKQNDQRAAQLISTLSSRRLGGILIQGYYQEEGDEEPTPEKSFFVPNTNLPESEFRHLMATLAAKYQQEAVLYSDGNSIGFLTSSGSFEPMFRSVSFDARKIANAWSELRGKKFTFLEAASCNSSSMGRLLWEKVGLEPNFTRGQIRQLRIASKTKISTLPPLG